MQNAPLRFAPPPRRVPLSLRVVNFFNGWTQLGWGIFGFGMIFFWVFATNADFSFITFRNPQGRATGKVTKVESTNASEGHQSIYRVAYQYQAGGEWLDGTSYAKGSVPAEGDQVTVEYDSGNPKRSRIEGTRRAQFGPGVLLVAIFPAIGLIILIPALRTGIRRTHLLSNGILTTGTMIDRRPTNIRINNQPLWEVVFEFHDRNGQRQQCSARATNTSRLEDEEQEALLYDPDNPSKGYVIDEAPSRPKFDLNGDLEGAPVKALAVMILPGIVIAFNLLMAAAKFR